MSTLLSQLSSQVGDRTQESTLRVAERCVDDPSLLKEIAAGLGGRDAAVAADCAEVFTQVALRRPETVAPYAETLASHLSSPISKVRWEAVHALSLVAATPPADGVVSHLLDRLSQLIREDKSVIVRDYATSTLATYASAGPDAARAAHPHLLAALAAEDSKHASRALEGLKHVAQHVPDLRPALVPYALTYADHGKRSIREAATSLLRRLT